MCGGRAIPEVRDELPERPGSYNVYTAEIARLNDENTRLHNVIDVQKKAIASLAAQVVDLNRVMCPIVRSFRFAKKFFNR